MEKALPFLTGIILIMCGFVLNKIILLSINGLFLFILSLVFLFLWGALAYKVYRTGESAFGTAYILKSDIIN